MTRGRKEGGPRRPWKTTDLRVFKRDYGRIPTKDLANRLNRTPRALMSMAFKLGLTTESGRELKKKHSRANIKALIRQGHSAKEVAKLVGTNPRHIRWMAAKEFDEATCLALRENGRRAQRENNRPSGDMQSNTQEHEAKV